MGTPASSDRLSSHGCHTRRTAGRASGMLAAAILATGCLTGQALAHPHVWVTVQSEVMRDDAGTFTGLRHRWSFDELYTSFAIAGLDADGDGTYTREELHELSKINVDALLGFNYFTFARAGTLDLELTTPTEYHSELQGERLVLIFDLPFKAPVEVAPEAFAYQVYDPTYYISFELAEASGVLMSAADPGKCAPTVAEPADDTETTLSSLGESDYAELSSSGGFGSRYVPTVHVRCGS
ncbi:MAG: DUF1007 family protein [Rhizobiales bacterium]|nr:DUF1007 family protein [Hyphomicrobiales bacterium]